LDPRATYTVADRKAQFDLVNRLAGLLNHMSWAVDAIIGVRDEALARAAKLPENDALRKQAEQLAGDVDRIRVKIVATKEGGMITGEERLREYLGGLYGDVNQYEGRPTESQTARAEALARELEDVIHEFTDFTAKQLPGLNRNLEAKQLGAIRVLSEEDWRLILPYLRENELLFGVKVQDLLITSSGLTEPVRVFRKIHATQLKALVVH
jgi:hypothetical protein